MDFQSRTPYAPRRNGTAQAPHTFRSPEKLPRPDSEGLPLFSVHQLEDSLAGARNHLLSQQSAEGYWLFELEADVTISSEYVLLQTFLGNPIKEEVREGIGGSLRRRQTPRGGWGLFEGSEPDLSASVKAYFALKILGDHPDLPHMAAARRIIRRMGGAARVNIFTRITLALFGQIPWRTTPAMPVEIVLLPRWFFFHLSKVSYWSRTVLVPLLILYAKRPVCRLALEKQVRELFLQPPEKLRNLDGFSRKNKRKNLFILLDRILKRTEKLFPRQLRRRAIRTAELWTRERMKGDGGIGAIFPAMANAVMALKTLDCPDDDPDLLRGMKAIEDLLLRRESETVCQPCLSPIWDTAISLIAVTESGQSIESKSSVTAADWLYDQQVLGPGDWSDHDPSLEPGGWAFQFENSLYPDIDDTPMVLMALLRTGGWEKKESRERIEKGIRWILGMQNSDGGWGAFDVDNNHLYLNDIPFADHGALLDPSTSDLTARCIELLSMVGHDRESSPVSSGFEFLRREQEENGAWYGRWGVNYLYGTWSVLSALQLLGEDPDQPYIRRAVNWIENCQNRDGGWGESCYSYDDPSLAGRGSSSASQTAWALLGLLSAGEVNSSTVQRGVHYLLRTRNDNGYWDEPHFTGTGFPRVFYLRYHGYSRYFPLWALGVYRRLRAGGVSVQSEIRQAFLAGTLSSRKR